MNDSHDANGTTIVDGATKLEVKVLNICNIVIMKTSLFQASPLLNQPNGTKSPQKGSSNGEASKDPQPNVSNQTVPGPQSASCVVIDEKKKKSCKCCVIQQDGPQLSAIFWS